VGQPKGATLSVAALLAFFLLAFFFWVFFGAFLTGWAADSVDCAACAGLAVADGLAGAPAVSPAQAGTTIKANNNSNRFFMVHSLCG